MTSIGTGSAPLLSVGFNMGLSTCVSNKTIMKQKSIHENQIVWYVEEVLYIYSVLRQDSEVQQDVYLPEDRLVLAQVHLYSITDSILLVLFLSPVVVSILGETLKQSPTGYNAIAVLADKEADGTGWKLIHDAVFRLSHCWPWSSFGRCHSGLGRHHPSRPCDAVSVHPDGVLGCLLYPYGRAQ